MLDSRLQHATRKELSYADFLVDLLRVEATARRERYLKTRGRGWLIFPSSGRWSSLTSLSNRRSMNGWFGNWRR